MYDSPIIIPENLILMPLRVEMSLLFVVDDDVMIVMMVMMMTMMMLVGGGDDDDEDDDIGGDGDGDSGGGYHGDGDYDGDNMLRHTLRASPQVNISEECREGILATDVTAYDIFDEARAEVLAVMEVRMTGHTHCFGAV